MNASLHRFDPLHRLLTIQNPGLSLTGRWRIQQNPDRAIHWIIAENSPPESPLKLPKNDPPFTVISGAAFEKRSHATGSYHPAVGVNKILSQIDSRLLNSACLLVARQSMNLIQKLAEIRKI